MTKTYFLVHAIEAESASEAEVQLEEAYASGDESIALPDDNIHPGDARLVGWPVWNDIGTDEGAAPGSLLGATITILSTPMHLRAVRVDEDGELVGFPDDTTFRTMHTPPACPAP